MFEGKKEYEIFTVFCLLWDKNFILQISHCCYSCFSTCDQVCSKERAARAARLQEAIVLLVRFLIVLCKTAT